MNIKTLNETLAKILNEEYSIGTRFIRQHSKRNDIEEVVDILKTYNSKNELVKTEYVVTHDFLGQTIKDVVVGTTIARSNIIE